RDKQTNISARRQPIDTSGVQKTKIKKLATKNAPPMSVWVCIGADHPPATPTNNSRTKRLTSKFTEIYTHAHRHEQLLLPRLGHTASGVCVTLIPITRLVTEVDGYPTKQLNLGAIWCPARKEQKASVLPPPSSFH
ncbi:unnamed protein product, partial [Ectocarpus fasciculatus]